jgi:hypothetical protein
MYHIHIYVFDLWNPEKISQGPNGLNKCGMKRDGPLYTTHFSSMSTKINANVEGDKIAKLDRSSTWKPQHLPMFVKTFSSAVVIEGFPLWIALAMFGYWSQIADWVTRCGWVSSDSVLMKDTGKNEKPASIKVKRCVINDPSRIWKCGFKKRSFYLN